MVLLCVKCLTFSDDFMILFSDLTIEHKEVLAQLKNMESVLRDNRYETTELRKERDEYKKQLKTFCELHKQYQIRESIAHTKMQDALQMIEAALAEKNAAMLREKEIRGEFHLKKFKFSYKYINQSSV